MMNKAELIIALDVPNISELKKTLDKIPDSVQWFKVGLELFISEGYAVIELLKSMEKSVFLDLKLHDIPQTVANAIKIAGDYDVDLLTVHSIGGRRMLEAASEAALCFKKPPELVAVTTLTSLGEEDFKDLGISRTISEQAISLGDLAISSGINGLVTSAHEAKKLRNKFPNAILVTPGIRLDNDNTDDQKRVATPRFAIDQGATHLVVGRSILKAEDPSYIVEKILHHINRI